MKLHRLLLALITFALITVFQSCKKEKTEDNPFTYNSITVSASPDGKIQLIHPKLSEEDTWGSSMWSGSGIFIDKKGNKWLTVYESNYSSGSGSQGSVIYKFDGKKWERFSSSNLPMNLEYSIKNLW